MKGGLIEGVFSTREKALNFVKKQVNLNNYKNTYSDFYVRNATEYIEIEEFEVQ
jgi:hypothetical protein